MWFLSGLLFRRGSFSAVLFVCGCLSTLQWLRRPAGLQKLFDGYRAADIVRQALAHVHCDFYYVVLMQWSPQCEVLECAFVSLRLQDHRGRSVLGSHVEAEVL